MITDQIRLIGKAFLGNKDKFEVLVDNQPEYRKQSIAIVDWDATNNNYFTRIEDYDKEKRYKYAIGIQGGTASNLSPSLNINWMISTKDQLDKFIENPNQTYREGKKQYSFHKILNFQQDLLKIPSKLPSNFFDDYPIYKQFFEWIEQNCDVIRSIIIQKLYQLTEGLINRLKPKTLIFKIKEKGSSEYKYPGELEYVKKGYVLLEAKDKGSQGICSICEKYTELIPGFNYGFFSLDQLIFQNIFFHNEKKISSQYAICVECDNYCKEGLNVLERCLKFFAYNDSNSKQKDQKKIYHYLIPMIREIKNLKQIINRISLIREKYNDDQNKKISTEIQELQRKIESLNKNKKREIEIIKQKIKKQKKTQERYLNHVNTAYPDSYLLSKLEGFNISFVDLYYKETDSKQNPSVKEPVKIFYIEARRLKLIAESINKVKKELNLSQDFSFKRLIEILGKYNQSFFLACLEKLFTGQKLNYQRFIKLSHEIISKAWLYKYLGLKNLYYDSRMNYFSIFYRLFDECKILPQGR